MEEDACTGAVRFGLNGFAVVRDTEAEAVEVVEEIIARADADKVRDFGEAVKQAGRSTIDKMMATAPRRLQPIGNVRPWIS